MQCTESLLQPTDSKRAGMGVVSGASKIIDVGIQAVADAAPCVPITNVETSAGAETLF